MPARLRLRRSDLTQPGIVRRRRGRGFSYEWPDGRRVEDSEILARIKELVIPPAWAEVWICPHGNGHIQVVGTDVAGRRQYRYHDRWRELRDEAKFDRVLEIAERLPAVRAQVDIDLATRGLNRDRVLGCAIRLLDLGFFRVGGEQYAEEHGTYGLATMLREHVSVHGDELVFDYTAKSGKHRVQAVVDPMARAVVSRLLTRDDPAPALLAFRRGSGWQPVHAGDINDRLRELAGVEISAKDFRTWAGTVLAAVALAVSERAAASPTARKRAVTRAVGEVAHYLGNTPAVCRASYIDPRVLDRFADGVTIAGALDSLAAEPEPGRLVTQGDVEAAVIGLLQAPSRPARLSALRPRPCRARAGATRSDLPAAS